MRLADWWQQQYTWLQLKSFRVSVLPAFKLTLNRSQVVVPAVSLFEFEHLLVASLEHQLARRSIVVVGRVNVSDAAVALVVVQARHLNSFQLSTRSNLFRTAIKQQNCVPRDRSCCCFSGWLSPESSSAGSTSGCGSARVSSPFAASC